MAQTAVEQLVNYMKENFHLTDEALEKFEQAKQIENEQIINAQMDMFNHINDLYYSLDYLNRRDAALKYAADYSTRLQNETN
jgi:DNA-binding protein H-NS